MTPSDDRDRPFPDRHGSDDVDPTGMRDLLRSLPDPGPMPEDLVRRIETRLAVELAHRRVAPPLDDEDQARHGAGVTMLSAERSRRRPAGRTVLVLGAAAAGLVLTTAVAADLLGSGVVGGADTAAYAPASGSAGSDGSGSAEGGAGDGQAADSPAEERGEDSSAQDEGTGDDAGGGAAPAAGDDGEMGGFVVLPHLGQVDEGTLQGVVTNASEDPAPASAVSSISVAQAKSCWSTVADDEGWASLYAAPATVDARPAVALWGRQDDGSGHAWLLPGDCDVNPSVAPLADTPLPR